MFSDVASTTTDMMSGCRSPVDSAVSVCDSQGNDDVSVFDAPHYSTPSSLFLSSAEGSLSDDVDQYAQRHCRCINNSPICHRRSSQNITTFPRQSSCSSQLLVQDSNAREITNAVLPDLKILQAEKVEVSSICGQGGFGYVRKGLYRGRPVALKYKRDSLVDSSLHLEAQMCSLVRHSCIVDFYGIAIMQNGPCLVMEYCAGGSLMKVLSKFAGNVQPPTALKWALEIAEGMRYLHTAIKNAPILHCDLKSANVVLVNEMDIHRLDTISSNSVKICDFGSARFASDRYRQSTCTFSWLSPEAIRNSRLSIASDVWSFGVVLWELMAGKLPYRNLTQTEIAFGIATQTLQLTPPRSCPKVLCRIMEDCWLYDPSQRPNFNEICGRLRQVHVVDFTLATMESTVSDLQQKEMELRSREEDIHEEEEQRAKERLLLERGMARLNRLERTLNEREKELSSLELAMEAQDRTPVNTLPMSVQEGKKQNGILSFFKRLRHHSSHSGHCL